MKYIAGSIAGLCLMGSAALATPVNTMVTPDIIYGTGNSNGGFTIETVGSLELGLRAHLRYGPSGPNDTVGVGIIQNSAGDYLFDSSISTAPSGLAMWNFDWAINSSVADPGGSLGGYSFELSVDRDASSAVDFVTGSPFLGGAYFGDNSTANGGGTYVGPTLSPPLYDYNVAQNSVNYGFLPTFPTGEGFFAIRLSAFDTDAGQLVASTTINVVVSPVPLPAALPLLAGALGGLGFIARRRRRKS